MAIDRVRAAAATRIGVSLAEYDARRSAGEKWCAGCKLWHAATSFGGDRSRGDGYAKWCRDFHNQSGRQAYVSSPGPIPGRRYADARGGDQKQARGRVNHLVNVGVLPAANSLPCIDCGHVWILGERRHEYDHHLGYAPEHHEAVEPVCTTCHHARENRRRAA